MHGTMGNTIDNCHTKKGVNMKKEDLIEMNNALLSIIEEIRDTVEDQRINDADTVNLISTLLDSISPEEDDEEEDEDEQVLIED